MGIERRDVDDGDRVRPGTPVIDGMSIRNGGFVPWLEIRAEADADALACSLPGSVPAAQATRLHSWQCV